MESVDREQQVEREREALTVLTAEYRVSLKYRSACIGEFGVIARTGISSTGRFMASKNTQVDDNNSNNNNMFAAVREANWSS